MHKWDRILKTFSAVPKSKVIGLIHEGVPELARTQVWEALIKHYGISQTEVSYRKFLLMPDNKAVEQIKLDLCRTLTTHKMFEEKNGEGQMKLFRVLKAYSYYNPAVGYCQGMSYLAAILLTVVPEEDAFYGLCHVINGMEGYFVPTMWELLEDGKIFKYILAERLPEVHAHLQNNGILPLMFICKWFMTMFSQLPWNTVLRIFDMYLVEGKTTLFRFGYSILSLHREEILNLGSIDVLLPYLLEPNSKKLQSHFLVPYATSYPIEHYVRTAVAYLRDGQDVLTNIANAGTPKKKEAPRSSSAGYSGGGGGSSFFERFMTTIATPVRSAVKKKVDVTDTNQPRVVATPPHSMTKRNLNFAPLSPMSPNSPRVNVSIKNKNTPPMFEGMKKRVRNEAENDVENMFSPQKVSRPRNDL